MESKRETFMFYNNLICLVKAIEGRYTTIDLRNESCVTGKVSHVDGFMNISLEDAVFYDPRESTITFVTFFVQSRNIRFVHIPKDMPILETVQKQMEPKKVIKKAKTEWKGKRAARYQQETLEEISKQSASTSQL